MKIADIDFKKLFKYLEYRAFNYGGTSKRYIMNGKDVVKLEGYIYEPGYNSFSATHSIVLNEEMLFGKDAKNVGAYHNEVYTFGKFNSDKEAIEYLKQYFEDREIIIKYDEQREVEDAESLFGKNNEDVESYNDKIERIRVLEQILTSKKREDKLQENNLQDEEEIE